MLDIKSDDVSINFDLEDNKMGKGKWNTKILYIITKCL